MKYGSVLLLSCSLYAAESPSATTPFNQGEIPPDQIYSYGYNAPSQVRLNHNYGDLCSFFIDGTFLYYHADQEGMDIATSAALEGSVGSYVTVATDNSQTAFQSFAYKPGFQVGIGIRGPSWNLSADYTWIRQTTNTAQSAPNTSLAGAIPVWIMDNWFEQTSTAGQLISANSFSSQWHLSMNWVDVMLSRPLYQSRRLTLAPALGLRGLWISQSLNMNIAVPTQVVEDQISSIYSNNSSDSWAIGPRAALGVNVLLGRGFRLEGDLAASLLFTKYTNVSHKESVASIYAALPTLGAEYKNYCCTRPVVEMMLGLGWGMYLAEQRYHIDLSTGYNFSVFWDQNMMRKLMDSTISGVGGSAGNLNINGLTVKAAFDF